MPNQTNVNGNLTNEQKAVRFDLLVEELARVTEERDEASGRLNIEFAAAGVRERDLRARVAELTTVTQEQMVKLEEIHKLRQHNAELVAALTTATNELQRATVVTDGHPSVSHNLMLHLREVIARSKSTTPAKRWEGVDELTRAVAEFVTPAKHPDAERTVALLESALKSFKAMPEANPSHTRDGIWALWTDGCNALGYALDSIRKQGGSHD